MDSVKSVADALEHLLYETFGVLLPGLAFALALVAVWIPWSAARALAWFEAHQVLGLVAAYVLGYAVQGLAHPITRPVIRALRRRHAGRAASGVSFRTLAREHWGRALRLDRAEDLSDAQVRDLSYSVIGPTAKRLERFRAAEGLTRGVAVAGAVAFLALVVQAVFGWRACTPEFWLALGAVAVAVAALCERAARYDRLWSLVLESQFAATALCDETAGKPATAAVAPPSGPPAAPALAPPVPPALVVAPAGPGADARPVRPTR